MWLEWRTDTAQCKMQRQEYTEERGRVGGKQEAEKQQYIDLCSEELYR